MTRTRRGRARHRGNGAVAALLAASDPDAMVGVSRLAIELGDQLVGLDINPMIVLPKGQGVVAVDALVEIK